MTQSNGTIRPWRRVAEELAQARDPERILNLANELTAALDAQLEASSPSNQQLRRDGPDS